MKLIVGLGNPGKEYKNTRHNIGFEIIESYLEKNNLRLDNNKFHGLYTKTKIKNQDVIFLEPQKYMNLSGEVVRELVDFYKINSKDILVIRDDLDLNIGVLRIKDNSSSGGHNGIKNIEKHLGTKDYKQLKIGISNDKTKDTKDYVLGNFSKEEEIILKNIINESMNIIDDFLDMDFYELTNKYNKR